MSDIEKFSVTMDSKDPRITKRVVINIPIEKYANDKENGMAIVLGKMEEAKAVLINLMRQKMIARESRLVKPNAPIKPSIA